MHIHPTITLERVMAALDAGGYPGFCVACGEETEGADPDTEGGECEACGRPTVYGAEALLISVL